jgi:hypothetical protein
MRLPKRIDIFIGHGSDPGVRIWVNVLPETFSHQVTLHFEGPEVIVFSIKLLDERCFSVGADNLLVYLLDILKK